MKKIFLILFAAILIIIESISAFAEIAVAMPPIEKKETSLTISFFIEHNGIELPVEGAEMAVYKVADVACIGGSPEYTLLPEYVSLQKKRGNRDITFNGLTSAESLELAKKLSAMVSKHQFSATTGADGKCVWNNAPHGMYLVKQISAKGEAAQYETIDPYLVSLPLGFSSEENSYWKYDVLSLPKTTVVRKHDTDSEIDSDSDTDTDTDIDTDIDTDSDSDSDSDKDSGSDSDKNTDSDKKSNESTPSNNTTPTYTPATYTTGNTATPTPITDIEKVKTGVVTNVMSLFIILFLSLIIIAIAKDKKSDNKNNG